MQLLVRRWVHDAFVECDPLVFYGVKVSGRQCIEDHCARDQDAIGRVEVAHIPWLRGRTLEHTTVVFAVADLRVAGASHHVLGVRSLYIT